MKTITLIWMFLGPVYNSVKGKINREEFIRICILAFTSGTSTFAPLTFIYMNMSQFITDPSLINLITGIVALTTFCVDYWRRKYHGKPNS